MEKIGNLEDVKATNASMAIIDSEMNKLEAVSKKTFHQRFLNLRMTIKRERKKQTKSNLDCIELIKTQLNQLEQ